jgi:Ca-activated chloride channel family protein
LGCGAGANRERVVAAPNDAKAPATQIAKDDAPAERPRVVGSGPWIGGGTATEVSPSAGGDHEIALWVDVPDDAKTTHVPTVLTLTIDTSGSMRGDKIRHARKAAQAVVDRLKDGDIVALHTFSDDARVRVPQTVLTPDSRRHIAAVIEELSANGATNLFDGIKIAEAETWRAPATHVIRRVVVISDGKATVGPSDPNSIGQLAEVGVSRGVQVSSIGVGLDYDESALNALAMRSSGRLYHLTDSSELGAIVEREVALLDKTLATDAVVELVAAPGVSLRGVSGGNGAWNGGTTLRVPLGALFAGQTRELAVRAFVSASEEPGSRPLVSARLHFKDPADGNLDRVQEIVVRSSHKSDRAAAVLATLEAAELASQAVAQANAGDFTNADLQLARAQSELEKSAKDSRDDGERRRLVAKAKKIERSRSDMRAAAAAPPAARPRAMRKSALEANDAALDMMGF